MKNLNTKEQTGLKIGSRECNLERLSKSKPLVSICPWHWILVDREDRFPFKRANAKCNCENCQAKTIYDSNGEPMSSCQNEYVLMPVLYRESLKDDIERWSFNLEEVPMSCACSISLKLFYW